MCCITIQAFFTQASGVLLGLKMIRKQSLLSALLLCAALLPRLLMSDQVLPGATPAQQDSGLSVFDTRTAELRIPTLSLANELLDIRLRLDPDNILTLVDSQNTERRTAVTALFDSNAGIAHVPYAAIFNNGELEVERYSLKLQLIEETPFIKLKILALEPHELSVATVTGNAVGRVGVLARSLRGESVAVSEDPTYGDGSQASAGAIHTTESGDSVSVFVDESGRPLMLVADDLVVRFSDYTESTVTLTLIEPNGNESAYDIEFDSEQMDALLADFDMTVKDLRRVPQVQALEVSDLAPSVPESTSRMLSYGANVLTYASCLAINSQVFTDFPEGRGRALETCTSATLAAARIQAEDPGLATHSSCAAERLAICAPAVIELEARLTRASGVVAGIAKAASPGSSGKFNPVWSEIPNTKLDDVAFDWSSQGGAPGSMGVPGVYAFSGAALDTGRNRLLIHGGGHGDYGGQEIYAFDIDTFTWSMVAPPDNKSDLRALNCSRPEQDNYGYRTANNFPKSRHTYDRLVYVEQYDALLDGGGSVGYSECRGVSDEIALYRFGANKWEWWSDEGTHRDDLPFPADYAVGGPGAAAAVHPVTKEIWFVPSAGGGRIARWNPASNTWTHGRSDNHLYITTHKIAVIDSKRNNLIIHREAYPDARTYIVPLDRFAAGSTRAQDYRVTTTGDNEFLSFEGGRRVAMDYDPVGDQLVAWAGGSEIYTMNPDTLEWTRHSVPGDVPGVASASGTYGRFRYVASIDKFILARTTNSNVVLLDLRSSGKPQPPRPPEQPPRPPEQPPRPPEYPPRPPEQPPRPPEQPPRPPEQPPRPPEQPPQSELAVVSMDLTTQVTGNVPFTAGVAFRRGDIQHMPTVGLDDYQVEVKRRWADGSAKHAIVSGTYPSVANRPFTVEVYDGGEVPRGTNLTNADIIAAAPAATVDLGRYGSVSLGGLLSDPKRIWLQGPEMIEAHYQAPVPGNDLLSVWFQVRLYASGQMRVRALVDYGFITNYDMPTIEYNPTVTINGTVVYNNGGKPLSQHRHTRWTAEGWIGTADPDITVRHDTDYLTATKLVPNYWKHDPSEATLDGLSQQYSPMALGDWRQTFGMAGYHRQIGLLPGWDALYLTSDGDPRAYKSVVTNGHAIYTHPIIWSDPSTHAPILPSDWPGWTFFGDREGSIFNYWSGPNTWGVNHHGSAGYLAYILTGDYHFLEALQYTTTNLYLAMTTARGSGEDRALARFEKRGDAWALRTAGQAAAIGPEDDPLTQEMASILSATFNWHNDHRLMPGQNELGFVHFFSEGKWGGSVPAWMYNFLIQSLGYVSDLGTEDLIDTTNLIAIRDHSYKAVVGRMGGNGTDQFCYTKAGDMNVRVVPLSEKNPDRGDPTTWLDSWGDVYQATYGEPNNSCGTVMEGRAEFGPGTPSGYWANMLPALSYAVEHGAPGAAEALNRLMRSDNFRVFENSGFENQPMWGVWPRQLSRSSSD